MKFSKFISIFFHPINFPILGTLIYFLLLPKYIFKPQEYMIVSVILIGTYLFPLIFLFLLKRFKMINSYHLTTIEERKFPTLLFISLTYILANWLLKTSIVDVLSLLFFGYGLAFSIIYILFYFKLKISLHTAGISGLIGFLIYYSFYYKINLIPLFIVLFLLSGIIASSRLKLKAHTTTEVFLGFLIGIIAQFVVFAIYYII